jgi:hypothetical protein
MWKTRIDQRGSPHCFQLQAFNATLVGDESSEGGRFDKDKKRALLPESFFPPSYPQEALGRWCAMAQEARRWTQETTLRGDCRLGLLLSPYANRGETTGPTPYLFPTWYSAIKVTVPPNTTVVPQLSFSVCRELAQRLAQRLETSSRGTLVQESECLLHLPLEFHQRTFQMEKMEKRVLCSVPPKTCLVVDCQAKEVVVVLKASKPENQQVEVEIEQSKEDGTSTGTIELANLQGTLLPGDVLSFFLSGRSSTYTLYLPSGCDLRLHNPQGAVTLQTSNQIPALLWAEYSQKSNWVRFGRSTTRDKFRSGSCFLRGTEGGLFDASLWSGDDKASLLTVNAEDLYLL